MAIQKLTKDSNFEKLFLSEKEYKDFIKITKTHDFRLFSEIEKYNIDLKLRYLICNKCNIRCHNFSDQFEIIYHTSKGCCLNLTCDEVIIKGIIE